MVRRNQICKAFSWLYQQTTTHKQYTFDSNEKPQQLGHTQPCSRTTNTHNLTLIFCAKHQDWKMGRGRHTWPYQLQRIEWSQVSRLRLRHLLRWCNHTKNILQFGSLGLLLSRHAPEYHTKQASSYATSLIKLVSLCYVYMHLYLFEMDEVSSTYPATCQEQLPQ